MGILCKKNYFEGWYFKCVSDEFSIAFIPSYHIGQKDEQTAILQVITDEGSYVFEYDNYQFLWEKGCLIINLGESFFSTSGIKININSKVSIKGELNFSSMMRLKSDIMGPFKYVPLLQCRHRIVSLYHLVDGYIIVNSKRYEFNKDAGYIESDRGSSFPRKYLWTHCNIDKEGTVITLSVATVKALGINFKGTIGVILYKGKKYRMATYLGAKIKKFSEKQAIIEQGDMKLFVEQISSKSYDLKAPVNGEMKRVIRESLSCKVHYQFSIKDELIIDKICDRAGFEYSDIKIKE